MKVIRIARDGTTCYTNSGHRIADTLYMDESEFSARNVLSGLRRADAEQRFAATGTSADEDDTEIEEYLPSEIFLG